MRPMITAAYFGRAHLGAINGIMRPFLTLSTAGSPLLVAWLYDREGSYTTVFWVIAACWFGAAAATSLARAPDSRSPTPSAVAVSGGG